MLVINGDRPNMPGTEQRVVRWMRSWTGEHAISGIAVSGCFIPDRRGDRSYEADFVVITPQRASVIEVKGPPPGVGGRMTVHPNQRWTIPGVPGDPIHVRAGDTTPLDQLSERVFDLKHLIEANGILTDVFVAGAVLIVPSKNAALTLDRGPMPTGRDVLLGDTHNELRAWFHTAARRVDTPWTAERVLQLLAALGITSVTASQLAAEGFAVEQGLAATFDLDPAAVPSTAASPVAPAYSPPKSSIRRPTHTGDLGRSTTDYQLPAAAPSAPASSEPSRTATTLVAAVFALIIGAGTVALGISAFSDDENPASSDQPSQTEVVEPAPPHHDLPAPPPVEIAPPPAPAPERIQGCYPFQSGC